MQKISIKREKRGDADVFRIGGPINEEAGIHFIQLYNDAGKRCIFNFKDVTLINSNGIRAWVLFLRDFQEDREIELEECSPAVVQQLNMLPSFRQKAKVRSLYVQYNCTTCNTVTNVLIDERDFPTSNDGLKPGRCRKCMTATQVLDDDEYFGFVRR